VSQCAFCGCDPYHYVHNGLGMEAVAITCCDLGCAVYDHRNDPDAELSVTVHDLGEIATRVSYMAAKLEAYESKYGEIWNEEEPSESSPSSPPVTTEGE
jgi:hypothetical protein